MTHNVDGKEIKLMSQHCLDAGAPCVQGGNRNIFPVGCQDVSYYLCTQAYSNIKFDSENGTTIILKVPRGCICSNVNE